MPDDWKLFTENLHTNTYLAFAAPESKTIFSGRGYMLYARQLPHHDHFFRDTSVSDRQGVYIYAGRRMIHAQDHGVMAGCLVTFNRSKPFPASAIADGDGT